MLVNKFTYFEDSSLSDKIYADFYAIGNLFLIQILRFHCNLLLLQVYLTLSFGSVFSKKSIIAIITDIFLCIILENSTMNSKKLEFTKCYGVETD
jgi:hypothetical protein